LFKLNTKKELYDLPDITTIKEEILNNNMTKAVLSKPRLKSNEEIKIVINKKEKGYQAESYTKTQVFHKNLSNEDTANFFVENAGKAFLQANVWTSCHEYIMLSSKKGNMTVKRKDITSAVKTNTSHNKKKNYIIEEGSDVPALVDMGIFTKDGKVVSQMYDKFRQINRFVEIIDDTIKNSDFKKLNIIDFGCGKSYLTFILYHYFTKIKNIDVKITGLDLKKDVIENCNKSAQKYGYTNLRFELGDINGYKTDENIDMVITLHACDTATDYALYNAINWNAKLIFSVPCCQHEVNSQINSDKLSILTRYGILKERTSAIITDAIRGNMLTSCGYKTQIMEFIDMAHTPKNVLIRATKQYVPEKTKLKAMEETESIIEEFNLSPTLYNLLK
jgi:SAM-dependent methyltransferase